MWKIYATKTKPFWAIQNGNKPSKSIFEQFDNTLELITGELNFVDFLTANFVGQLNDYKYFKVVNTENNDTKYYYVNSVEYVQDKSYVYVLILDIYTSYTINFIEQNKDVILTLNRTHQYNKEIGVLGDKIIDEIPKTYSSIAQQRFYYANSTDGKNNYYFNSDFGLKNPENNAYKYYVFSDGPSGTYTIFPCINNTREIDILEKEYYEGDLLYTGYFKNGDYQYKQNPREYIKEIPSDINVKIKEAYKKGEIVKYYYRWLKDNISWVQVKNWKQISTIHNTMPTDLYMTGYYHTQTPGFDAVGYTFTSNGSQFNSNYCDGITWGNWDHAWKSLKQLAEFKVEIYARKTIERPEPKKCYNSKQHLFEVVLKDPNYSNKFVGVFAGPNLLTFKAENIGYINVSGKQFMTITLPASGIEMDEFPIYRYVFREKDCINNTDLGYEYSLKYLNINYYNNNINGLLRANNQQLILLSGNLIFSNGFYLINKNSDLLSLSNSIIYFGGELPNSQDNYVKYVNSQRNTLDTSYSIKRQETTIKNTQSIANGVIDYASAAGKAAVQAVTGDFGGAINSAIGGMKAMAKGVYGVFEGERQLKNYRRTMSAQFTDANINMGNQINMSNASDASLQLYLESEGEQFEVVEVVNISANTNVLINNYLYLHGFFYPHANTFEKFLSNKRKFNYVEVEHSLLQTNINLKNNFTNDILELVKSQLVNGIRIWNTDTVILPDNFTQPEIQQQNPDYEVVPLPPPNSEIPEWKDDVSVIPPKIYTINWESVNERNDSPVIYVDKDSYWIVEGDNITTSKINVNWAEYDEIHIKFNFLKNITGVKANFALFNANIDDEIPKILERKWKFYTTGIPRANFVLYPPLELIYENKNVEISFNDRLVWPWFQTEDLKLNIIPNKLDENSAKLQVTGRGERIYIRYEQDNYTQPTMSVWYNIYFKNAKTMTITNKFPKPWLLHITLNYMGDWPSNVVGGEGIGFDSKNWNDRRNWLVNKDGK